MLPKKLKGRKTDRPRSRRIGLKPLASPAVNSWWMLCNPTRYFDEKEYRVVVVVDTQRKYGRMGMQEAFVVFAPAHLTGVDRKRAKYSMQYDKFCHFFRELKGDELDDEMAMILLANV